MQPARVEVVRVARPTTLQELDAEQPSSIDLDRLAIVNQAQPQERLEPGALVKRVVGGSVETRPS